MNALLTGMVMGYGSLFRGPRCADLLSEAEKRQCKLDPKQCCELMELQEKMQN